MRHACYTGDKLKPVGATMSSTFNFDFEAERCIDGDTDGPDEHAGSHHAVRPSGGFMCHTEGEPTPWIAVDYNTTVTVQRVEIFNRLQCCGNRTRNVDVRISDELPTSGIHMFSGGHLLGHFAGPGSDGQLITISGQKLQSKYSMRINIPGQAKSGRYVIVQMDNGEDSPLNLKEVTAFGRLGKGRVHK